MLTSQHLQVRIRKGVVQPLYIDPESEDLLEIAGALIHIFDQHRNCTRAKLEEELKDYLGTGTEYLFYRGLAKLLMDRCEFEVSAFMDPPELRMSLFEFAGRAWSTNAASWNREEVLNSWLNSWKEMDEENEDHTDAEESGLSFQEVERSLYADLKEEQVLTEFRKVTASWLLHRYNVALAQAVLYKATSLEIQLKETQQVKLRAVFQKLKFFQLLHSVQGNPDEGYVITLDGPLSLFKSSQKYGLQMANFLPSLLHCECWKLEAQLLWGKGHLEKKFHLSSEQQLKPHSDLRGQWQPDAMSHLLIQFPKKRSDWTISQQPEVINLGGEGVLVPDYVFEHPSGLKVYLEIFGFWRKGAVSSRLDLLKRTGPHHLILAISKELGVEEDELKRLPNEVYLFRSTPIAGEILKRLNRFLD